MATPVHKLVLSAVVASCFSIAGCADLRLRTATLFRDPAPAVPIDWQPDPQCRAEQTSYYAEFAPWRTRVRQAGLLRSTMASSEANLGAQTEIAPADADELARWLEQRRERAKQYHEVHLSWLNELDQDAKEIIQSICHGC